jgi:molecular chaperone DnaJ
MAIKTYYETLAVTKTATDDEIKVSYRKLAIKFHPDKNKGDTGAADRFKDITLAYETLRDPGKRKRYDTDISRTGVKKGPAVSGDRPKFDLAEALRVFMTNMRVDSSLRETFEHDVNVYEPSHGQNRRISLPLTLNEIAAGVQKTIKIRHKKQCLTCKGTGSRSGKLELTACRQCDGRGIVRYEGQENISKCNVCAGSGKVPENICVACKGEGRVDGETTVSVNIAKGIAEGNTLTLKGMGDAGLRGGVPGDFLFYIEEEENPHFRRKGYNLETDCVVSLLTSVLGGQATARSLAGETIVFSVPAGTQPEALFCIKGKGLPLYQGQGAGNLYARIHVQVPTKLSGEELKLYEEISLLSARHKSDKAYEKIGRFYLVKFNPDEAPAHFESSFDTIKVLLDAGSPVAIDLRGILFFDSMSIGSLVNVCKRLQKQNERLILLGASPEVRETFSLVNIEELLDFVESPAEIEQEEAEESNSEFIRNVNGAYLIYAGIGTFSPSLFEDQKVRQLLNKTGNRVGLDLREITSVTSLIIGTWVRLWKETKNNGVELFLFAPSPNILKVLKETNLHNLFRIVEGTKEIVNA